VSDDKMINCSVDDSETQHSQKWEQNLAPETKSCCREHWKDRDSKPQKGYQQTYISNSESVVVNESFNQKTFKRERTKKIITEGKKETTKQFSTRNRKRVFSQKDISYERMNDYEVY